MKKRYGLAIIFLCLLTSRSISQHVEFNETYELANIILALTEYGKSDPLEVEKHTTYYTDVITYFGMYSGHPLIQKVNYSREKWDKLLSFRTDAYAFVFTSGNRLKRHSRFYAMGKEINEFEKNIALVEDFASKSNFRAFYKQQQPLFAQLKKMYEATLMIPEVKSFLNKEFAMKPRSEYIIVVSPLVGRMHCQREVNGVSVSFINIPGYLYNVQAVEQVSVNNLALNIHMFFTEIDHDYVNPTTKHYKILYYQMFNPAKWDKESGYAESEFATFNEYMTWAVYDLFMVSYFPQAAPAIVNEWHEINESRGFFASKRFGQHLLELYQNRKPGERIIDLYPGMLRWCGSVQDTLR